MTLEQEEFALRSCHPLYDAFCREGEDRCEDGEELVECEECGYRWSEQTLDENGWHCPNCKHKLGE